MANKHDDRIDWAHLATGLGLIDVVEPSGWNERGGNDHARNALESMGGLANSPRYLRAFPAAARIPERTCSNFRSTVPYRLQELAALARELNFPTRRVHLHQLDVTIGDGCILTFSNLPAENDTLVGFDGTPWHSHGLVQFLTGDATYIDCDELAILVGLGTGELVIVSQVFDGQLRDRWIAHRNERLDVRHIQPGEELRVLCIPAPRG